MVLNNPFSPREDPVNHQIFERFFTHIDVVKSRKEWVESIKQEITEDITTEIYEIIDKNSPDLLTNFNIIYQELTTMMKEFQKTIRDIEKKAKKVFDSSSLAEDCYKMRDEMKIIKKKIDKLNAGLRNLSRLSTVLGDEKDE